MKSRAQQDLLRADEHVRELLGDQKTAEIYGGLCLGFPIMVRQSGLCQTLAFHLSKAGAQSNPREKAHAKILEHVAKVLGASNALQQAQTAGVQQYWRDTQRVLEAWAYYKRFAVAVLKAKPEEANDQLD